MDTPRKSKHVSQPGFSIVWCPKKPSKKKNVANQYTPLSSTQLREVWHPNVPHSPTHAHNPGNTFSPRKVPKMSAMVCLLTLCSITRSSLNVCCWCPFSSNCSLIFKRVFLRVRWSRICGCGMLFFLCGRNTVGHGVFEFAFELLEYC